MEIINWCEDFETGFEIIDLQHRVLVETLNELIRASHDKSNKALLVVQMSLDCLIDYAGYHFYEEEKLMKTINYSDSELHTKIHQEFKKKVSQYVIQHKSGENILTELIQFLFDWLFHHIKTDDVDLVRALKNEQSKESRL